MRLMARLVEWTVPPGALLFNRLTRPPIGWYQVWPCVPAGDTFLVRAGERIPG